MVAVIQRVLEAQLVIEGNMHSEIGKGMVVLLGVAETDTTEDVEWVQRKVVGMRIFADEAQKMNKSLVDISGELLVVSQFTLLASTVKGNRPSFLEAARPEKGKALYDSFVEICQKEFGNKVKTGVFGADMKVTLCNDGPVTILLDSKNKK